MHFSRAVQAISLLETCFINCILGIMFFSTVTYCCLSLLLRLNQKRELKTKNIYADVCRKYNSIFGLYWDNPSLPSPK